MLGGRTHPGSTGRLLVRMAAAVGSLVALTAALPASATSSSAHATSSGAIVPGFNTSSFGPNDDGSYACTGSGAGVPAGCSPSTLNLPFSINFYGHTYGSLYLNNNGNLTFGQPFSEYTPVPLNSTAIPIIAPFFADVDTRVGNTVTFGNGTIDGHTAFGVNWPGVGCYSEITSVLNDFQVLLIDRSDVAAGDFDIEFNYGQIQWDAGQASGGNSSCTNGVAARAGFSDGSGSSANTFEIAGSGTDGAFLDSNATTGLVHGSHNSSQLGRYVYQFRGGQPATAATLPLIVIPGITGSYLRSPFGEAWPRALDMFTSVSDS